MNCRTALLTVLDQVDFTQGACSFTEMVGAVLPKEVIALARQAIADETAQQQEEHNAALEWAANWITGAQMLGHSADVEEFAKNMAMSIRAAKRPTQHALDGGYCACPPSVPRYDAGDGWKCHWCNRPRNPVEG